MRLGLIVEGHGEVEAVPLLIRRIAATSAPGVPLEIARPHRVRRGKLVQEDELKRAVELVARKVGPGGAILVLLDADEDCPRDIAGRLLTWAQEAHGDRPLSVVVAKSEYEAWFLAAAESLRGRRGLPDDFGPFATPEGLRSPKSRLDDAMPDGYAETVDQARLSGAMDLAQAARAPSFAKFRRDVERLLSFDGS